MLTHDTEKKFGCDLCGKSFRNSSYLGTHRKACSGIKEEECAFCGKKFAKRAVLLNHERLHTGETPYKCRICGESFRTHHNYSGHGRSKHQVGQALQISRGVILMDFTLNNYLLKCNTRSFQAISAKHFHQLQDEAEAKMREEEGIEEEGGEEECKTEKTDENEEEEL